MWVTLSCHTLPHSPHFPALLIFLSLWVRGRRVFQVNGESFALSSCSVLLWVLQSCPSSWPLLTSCQTPLFFQKLIQVIPETFCFSRSISTQIMSLWGREVLSAVLLWAATSWGDGEHGWIYNDCFQSSQPRTHHPGRRLQLAGR